MLAFHFCFPKGNWTPFYSHPLEAVVTPYRWKLTKLLTSVGTIPKTDAVVALRISDLNVTAVLFRNAAVQFNKDGVQFGVTL